MIIFINSKSQVSDIQRDFNRLFPYLKIELFKHKHGYKEASPRQGRLPHYLYLSDLATQLPAQISVPESMTVLELEKMFEEQLGLNLQVFRKSGNLWLETTMTDGWSLKQQNDHGMEISRTPAVTVIQESNKDQQT